MSKTIEFIYDIVSPNGYLVWSPLKEIAARQNAEITITPVFLGGMHKLTGNAPPFIRDAEVKGKNAYAMLEIQRFIADHSLSRYRMAKGFPFNSITLQRMSLARQGDDRAALVEALLKIVWEDEVDATDADALGAALATAGYDPAELLAATQNPAVKQQLADNTEAAVNRGAFGIPTFYIGEEMFFGKERLGQMEKMLAS